MSYCLSGFQHVRPPFIAPQSDLIRWIAEAHRQAEARHQGWDENDERLSQFSQEILDKLLKIGLGPDKIKQRGFVIRDATHLLWDEMEIFCLREIPSGHGLEKRMQIFNQYVDQAFEELYPGETPLSPHLIHVTCTGYTSPSGAQKLVSKRKLGHHTTVTHAYHMGCYASLPGIRMAMGYASHSQTPVDIVHTEIGSLHFNPLMHDMGQLVIQSLFADGFMKYRLASKTSAPHFAVHTIREEILEKTLDKMTWECKDWGFGMFLSRDIPVLISREIEGFVERLIGSAHRDRALFAIHPGGPKIIQQVAAVFGLRPEQFSHSQDILKNYGNMSSATLPHIWEAILNDPRVPSGTPVISLGFGPGLTLSGAYFEKRS